MLSVEPTNNQSFKSRTILRVATTAFKKPENIKNVILKLTELF